jgi:hypothetical protein
VGIEIEIASREDFKKDFRRLVKDLVVFFRWKPPPKEIKPKRNLFGIPLGTGKRTVDTFKNLTFACLEVPGEMIERSLFTGTLAAIILYPIAYYSFLAYLVSYLLDKLFKLTGKYF